MWQPPSSLENNEWDYPSVLSPLKSSRRTTATANSPNARKIIVDGASLPFGPPIHNSSDRTNTPKPGCSSTPAPAIADFAFDISAQELLKHV